MKRTKIEMHKLPIRGENERGLDHSWVPVVGGSVLENEKDPDGLFLSSESAKKAAASKLGVHHRDLKVRYRS